MGKVFGVISVLVWLVGLFNATQVTVGIFCAATACCLAILVRLQMLRSSTGNCLKR